jgi:hypothetical protein
MNEGEAAMNISETFIRRPIATTLLMAGILIFGVVSYQLLPVSALPEIDFPTIVVTAQLPGASPDPGALLDVLDERTWTNHRHAPVRP